jgi:hypothetical protein
MADQNQSAVKKLSERAQILIHQMLDRSASASSIVRTIARTTHEKISPEDIVRYAKHYAATVQAEDNARHLTTHLVGEIIRQGDEVSEMLRAAIQEAIKRARKTGALDKMDPLRLEAADRHRQELDLRKKQLSLAERRVKVSEDRWKLDRKKGQATLRKLDRKAKAGQSLTAQEMERVREIYGLYDHATPARQAYQMNADETDGNPKETADREQRGNNAATN